MKFNKIPFVVIVLINIFCYSSALSQDSPLLPVDESDQDLSFATIDTVIVKDLPIQDWNGTDFFLNHSFAPADTLVFTQEDILNSTATTLGTFLEENSLFYLFDYGPHVHKEFLNYLNHPVEIVLDGRRWSNPQIGTENLKLLSLNQIEKIVIVKTSWGRNSLAIYIWSKNQTITPIPYTQVIGGNGTKDMQEYSIVFASPIRKQLTTVLTAFYQSDDGQFKTDHYTSKVYSIHLHYQINDKFSTHFSNRLAEQASSDFSDVRKLDYDVALLHNISQKAQYKLSFYNSRYRQDSKSLTYGGKIHAQVSPLERDLLTLNVSGEQYEYQDAEGQVIDATLSNEFKRGDWLTKAALTSTYHNNYENINFAPFLQLAYDVTSKLNLSSSVGKQVYYPELNSGEEDLEPLEFWQIGFSGCYNPVSINYIFKSDQDTTEIHQFTARTSYSFRNFSTGLNYSLTIAENPENGQRKPYLPRHNFRGNLDWNKNFYHDNLKLHGRLTAKYNTWVYTDYLADDDLDNVLLFDGKMEMKIYDLSISYNVNNITWQDYSRIEGYPLWRKIHRINLRWEFWN